MPLNDCHKMNIQQYLRPKLTGRRFESHAIPLEILRDFAALEEMVVEVAKWKFIQAHPGRQRCPRRFTDGITLTLTSVEDGSAIAVIALMVGTFFSEKNRVYYEQAREAIVGAISAAAENKSALDFLPERSLAYFDRFGRSLRDNEAIEFPSPNSDAPIARLTKEVRRKLLLASSEVNELTEEIKIRGAIHEADQRNMTFQITLADGTPIQGPIASQHVDNIMEAFQGFRQGTKVFLQGVGRFNRMERLQGIASVEHITLLDPQDITARFEELKTLKDGWMDGRGLAPASDGLDWLADQIENQYSEKLPLPYIYPVAEGGVQLEWSLKPHEVSLEIDFNQKSGEWHALNLDTDNEEWQSLDLREEAAWRWVIDRLSEMAGATQRD